MPDLEDDSLRASLERAFADTPETPEAPPLNTPSPPREDGRDELGRFAPKPIEGEGQEPVLETGTGQTETAQAATRKMPVSWSSDKTALWDKLDPVIQDQVLKRESDVDKVLNERAAKYKPYEELEPLFESRRQQWQLRGATPTQALQQLFAAQEFLERNPREGILWLARQYGIHPQALLQQQPEPQGQQQPRQQPDPIRLLASHVQKLQSKIEQAERTEQERQQAHLQSEVSTFAKDKPHFEAVRETMASLLNSGQSETLQDAYDKAVWLNPETRAEMIAAQTRQASKPDAIAKAKLAASSVKGAPTGNAPANAPKNTLREELEAAFEAHS